MFRITAFCMITTLGAVAEDSFPNPATTAPPEVVASAVAAVRDLGEQVVLGRFHVAVDRMNPMWKERAARRAGGMEKLMEQLDGVARQMIQQGVSIIASAPKGQPRAFEVSPGRKKTVVDGREVEEMIYTRWLILVPTVTTYRIMVEGEPRPVVIESTGFQVAVSEKEPLVWSFIDGASITVNELRSLFLTLPKDLELPPIERREAQ
jgi:hypothetical protein